MNLTVGPLPPAVYWRRRAIVAGALLVVVLLIVFSCSGGSGSPGAGSRQNTAAVASSSPTPGPEASYPAPSGSPSPSAPVSISPSVDASGSPAAAGTPACADADMKIMATIESTAAASTTLQYGGTFLLKLKIQNISDHACTRDVGSVPESLAIYQGKTKIWSSDDCGGDKGAKQHDIRTFPPNVLIYAKVYWNTYMNTAESCTKGKTPAPRGDYQLTGQLGTAQSTPTTFTIK
jgi:hypothetical protein